MVLSTLMLKIASFIRSYDIFSLFAYNVNNMGRRAHLKSKPPMPLANIDSGYIVQDL